MTVRSAYSRTRRLTGRTFKSGPVTLGWWYRRSSIPPYNWIKQPNPVTFNPSVEPSSQAVCVDEVHPGPPWTSGGPFLLSKAVADYALNGGHGVGSYTNRADNYRFAGGLRPPDAGEFGLTSLNSQSWLDVSSSTVKSLTPDTQSYGTQAWSRTKPDLQYSGGFVFAAELRDIPRMLQTTARSFHDAWKMLGGKRDSKLMEPKNLADQYLNIEFGWKPFLKDLQSFDKTMSNYQAIVARLTAINGKVIRRRVPVAGTSKEEVLGKTEFSSYAPIWPDGSPFDMTNGKTVKTLSSRVTENVWGVGAFSFYRPEFDGSSADYHSAWKRGMRLLTIYGARVSPINLYRAIPWTWAADWVTNLSDYFEYLSDVWTDQLTAKYFYCMATRKTERIINWSIPFASGAVSVDFSRSIEVKQRVSGNSPFGFSLAWKDLSPRQYAIAAALGITRT